MKRMETETRKAVLLAFFVACGVLLCWLTIVLLTSLALWSIVGGGRTYFEYLKDIEQGYTGFLLTYLFSFPLIRGAFSYFDLSVALVWKVAIYAILLLPVIAWSFLFFVKF
jgi:hypothetical protein